MNRLLILSASAGAGHLRAAQALERAACKHPMAWNVQNFDTLHLANPVLRHLYSKTYLDMVQMAPDVLGWMYDWLDTPWENDKIRVAFHQLNCGPFLRMFQKYAPDVALCTHFLPAELIAERKRKGKSACKLGVIVTDFDAHAMWLCREADYYFVALDETRVHLETLGIPPDKIHVTGIPIDPAFATPKDRLALRAEFGLEPDRTVILISAGGYGMGPVGEMVQALQKLQHPAHVIALCGRNAELKLEIDALPCNANVNLRALEHTDQMHDWMAAADLIIGKPGGLTTSEALASGLGMVIVHPIPGQEERNADHLLEKGVAIRCNNLSTLAYKVDALLDQPDRIARMRAATRTLARPEAAQEILRIVSTEK